MGHDMQETAPAVSLYFPVSHAVHVPPLAPVYPLLQRQAVAELLAAGDQLLLGHVSQEIDGPWALGVDFQYFPATHVMQVPVQKEHVPLMLLVPK